MENGKEVAHAAATEMATVRELSKVFYEAGIFKDIKSEAQAIVKIFAGREYGLSPMESMMGLYIVADRIAPLVQTISALVKKSKDYDYIVEKLDDTECVLSFTKEGKEIGKSSFTFKDAAKAGLLNKDNWKNYPRNMLFARAIGNGVRWYCPHIFGGSSMEELRDLGPQTPTEKTNVVIDATGEVTNGKGA